MPADSDLPPVLAYPVQHDPAGAEPAEQCADPERALAVRHTISPIGTHILSGTHG